MRRLELRQHARSRPHALLWWRGPLGSAIRRLHCKPVAGRPGPWIASCILATGVDSLNPMPKFGSVSPNISFCNLSDDGPEWISIDQVANPARFLQGRHPSSAGARTGCGSTNCWRPTASCSPSLARGVDPDHGRRQHLDLRSLSHAHIKRSRRRELLDLVVVALCATLAGSDGMASDFAIRNRGTDSPR